MAELTGTFLLLLRLPSALSTSLAREGARGGTRRAWPRRSAKMDITTLEEELCSGSWGARRPLACVAGALCIQVRRA